MHADFDNDGLLDVLVLRGAWMGAIGQFPVSLRRNQGGFRFADATRAAGLDAEGPSQTAAWFDYDNEGWLDLFIASDLGKGEDVAADYLDLESDRCRLYRNKGDGTFEDVTRAGGLWKVVLGMGLNHGDLDNDGWLDI